MNTVKPTDEMTSTGFVAYAIEVSRSAMSWDAAEHAFGRARWDVPAAVEPSTQVEADSEPQPA